MASVRDVGTEKGDQERTVKRICWGYGQLAQTLQGEHWWSAPGNVLSCDLSRSLQRTEETGTGLTQLFGGKIEKKLPEEAQIVTVGWCLD